MKKLFLGGLAILLPVALTFIVFAFIIDFFTEPFIDFTIDILTVFKEEHHVTLNPEATKIFARILILIVLCIFIFFLGVVARWFFFRTIIDVTNKIFSKIPFVKSIYKVTREIFVTLFSPKSKKAFKGPAITFFTSEKSYAVGFIAGEVPKVCQENSKEKLKSVIIPTAPHPISGLLMLVPENKVHPVDMTNEEAIKFIVSCGLIIPPSKKDAFPST